MSDGEVCNYCMQEMKAEQDPRKLPCGHVFCLTCLMDDCNSRGLKSHQCATCRRVYEQMDFNSLPTALTASESSEDVEELATTSDVLYCDRCLDKPAMRYCVDCGVKSCARHMEYHDGFYEGLHETLDIMKYAENPSLHNKAITCEHHKKECITMACKRCYQYNCLQCSKGAALCDDGVTGSVMDHSYVPLASVEDDIKQIFESLLKQAMNKLVEISKIEKQAWAKHDELLVKCKKMIAEVEKKSEEQIQVIKAQTEQLKESIQQYEAEEVDQVVTFVTELMKKKEKIDRVRRSTHKFLRNKHVTELIKIKQQKVKLLNKTNAINLGTCDWPEKCLRIGNKQRMEIELRTVKEEDGEVKFVEEVPIGRRAPRSRPVFAHASQFGMTYQTRVENRPPRRARDVSPEQETPFFANKLGWNK